MKVEGIELAKACALAANENKAENIRVLDVRGLSTLTDFMVVCSGTSMPHLKAVIRDIGAIVQENIGESPYQSEGKADSRWVVLDYADVMVHVLLEEMRDLYALEDLWGDAKDVEWGGE